MQIQRRADRPFRRAEGVNGVCLHSRTPPEAAAWKRSQRVLQRVLIEGIAPDRAIPESGLLSRLGAQGAPARRAKASAAQ